MDCYFLNHHLYVEHTTNGYSVKPCCRTTGNNVYTTNIQDISVHPYLQQVKEQFAQGIKPKECASCWDKEAVNEVSKRQFFEKKIEHANGIEDWDIRPGNTCNLKCVMCGPTLSSKWNEDKDTYEKHISTLPGIKSPLINWEFIKAKTPNKAKRIYIAGGEPFYLRQSQDFLEYLSTFRWNCKHTQIVIQTNGVSFNDKMLDILSKFENCRIGFSVDGLDAVNELIRFPTNWSLFISNYRKFKQLDAQTDLNVTVSALNLPNIDMLLDYFSDDLVRLNKLVHPEILHINSLAPNVIQHVQETTNSNWIKNLCNQYEYDADNRIRMQLYLDELDLRRKTNSKQILPWCWYET